MRVHGTHAGQHNLLCWLTMLTCIVPCRCASRMGTSQWWTSRILRICGLSACCAWPSGITTAAILTTFCMTSPWDGGTATGQARAWQQAFCQRPPDSHLTSSDTADWLCSLHACLRLMHLACNVRSRSILAVHHLRLMSKPRCHHRQPSVNAGSHKGSNSLFLDCYQNDELVNDTYFQVSSPWREAPLHKAASASRLHCSHAHSLNGGNASHMRLHLSMLLLQHRPTPPSLARLLAMAAG